MSASADVSLTIKTSAGKKYPVSATLDTTVADLKDKVATIASVPAEDQKLIFSGRILKNEQTLTECGVKEGTSLHLVQAKKKTAPAQEAARAPTQGTSAAPTGGANPNPFAAFGGMGGLGGGAGLGGERGMPSQEQLNRMMDNPMVQNMLNSPEVMEAMLMSNPGMRDIVEQNPELGRAMRDPAILRQAMEMQRNPEMMRESMRQQDRAMRNVESMPGGFNHLRNMYSNIQEPLERASDNMRQQAQAPAAPSGGTGSSAGGAGAAANPFAALFGNTNANSNAPSGASGAASGNSQGTGMAGMINNPVVMESMRQAMSNPEVLQQMASLNPYMNTEALRNPANLEAMIKMQQAMQQLDQAGITSQLQGLSAGAGNGAQANVQSMMSNMMSNPSAMQAMMQPDNMQAVMQLQQSMATLQQAGLMPSPEQALAGGLGGLGIPAAGAGAQQPNYRERYATQIAEVRAMGFTDEAAIIQALIVCEGSVENAINLMLS